MVANSGDNAGVDVRTLGAQLGRRRRAAARSEPAPCGHRDPLTCLARHRDNLTDRQLDGWAHTVAHLLEAGLPPLLQREVLRGLWRRGGDDRQLAQDLYDLAGGDA
jgi:hypothetical protein